jgi:hypothetical protein
LSTGNDKIPEVAKVANQGSCNPTAIKHKLAEICCGAAQARLIAAQIYKLFWGEQPPFTPIGRGGRYFFKDEIRMSKDEGTSKSEDNGFVIRASSLIRHSSFVLGHSLAGRISWPAALTLLGVVAAAVVVIIFYRVETWPMRTTDQGVEQAEHVARDIKQAFVDIAQLQPRVTINNRVYLEQTTPKSELTMVSRRIEVDHEFQNTWAGSSKRVKLHGTFNAKAGFDLRQDFSIDIRPDEIRIELPHAQILGMEQEQVDVLAFENGFWNRISADDVQNELSSLPQLAREKAIEANLPGEAERSLQQQITARVHVPQRIEVRFADLQKKGE